MKILLNGLRRFSKDVYPDHSGRFQELAAGQAPHTLLITCSDSRIDPALVTQTQPGEIFVVRNAGNIIPPYGSSNGGEEPSIEFAIEGLKVRHIVVCGHTQCGAMAALMAPEKVDSLPAVKRWLGHADVTRKMVKAIKEMPQLIDTVEMNVLAQIQNLKTHPAVAGALAKGAIDIFAWVYHFETGDVTVYDPKIKRFVKTSEVRDRSENDLKSLAV